MKYRGVLPEHNDNVSKGHPLKELASMLSAVMLILLLVYWLLGFLIDWAVDEISPQTEVQFYQSVNINVTDKLKKEAEQPTQDQTSVAQQKTLQPLLNQLAQCADIGYEVNLQVEQSDSLNAVAWPGGHIVVLSGLLDQVESQNGLAFVLAHELAHYKNRDHLRSMGRSIVLLALTAIVGVNTSDLASVLAPMTNLEAGQFSQQRETAADATALQILNCHYGHTGGATEFFAAINAQEAQLDFALLHYFSSHPQIEARIEAIEMLRQSLGYSVGETIKGLSSSR